MNPSCACGGCADLTVATPQSTANRPGLSALAYRVGTYGDFLAAMIARLSSQDYPALAGLTTRDPADPSVALLHSWALVADVLTFYQERIANEGYLRTATERRSILELARLIGYRLRPGVAATVYLAYTLDEDRSKTPPAPTRTLIAAGSRSQSVPGPGQKPQAFETSIDLDARSAWNLLRPRLTQPQRFTLNMDFGTDAVTRAAVYFRGTSTNLNPGDPLIFVLGTGTDPTSPQQAFRLVQSVTPQPQQGRTENILQAPPLPAPAAGASPAAIVLNLVQPLASDTAALFARSLLGGQVAGWLDTMVTALNSPGAANLTVDQLVAGLQRVASPIAPVRDLAEARGLTRLEVWLDQVLAVLDGAVAQIQSGASALIAGTTSRMAEKGGPLSNLAGLLASLARPPSLQPAGSLELARSVNQAFAPRSDMGPRLIGAFLPRAAPLLYRAWTNLQTATAAPTAGAARVKAGLFPGNYPGMPTVTKGTSTTTTSFDNPPTINSDWPGADGLDNQAVIFLDAVHDDIVAGSWVMIDRPDIEIGIGPKIIVHRPEIGRKRTFHKVVNATAVPLTTTDGGFTAKVTRLTLDPPWLYDLAATRAINYTRQPAGLTGTVVYAQTATLALAEEPLDFDLAGDTIELDGVYEGLESGRWIIVSGERTDIPNVTGVTGSEVVMILGVAQDTHITGTRPGSIHTILTLANKLAYAYDPATVSIYGNVVKATHGETRNEVLGNGDGSQPFQRFALKQKPLTFVPAPNPAGVDSTLAVHVNHIEWRAADTLAATGPKDRSFVVQTADDDTASVVFGNGQHGARLPTGAGNVTAVYRNGIGQPGNVEAGQISLLQTRPLNVKAVINPLRASGGADRDSRDQARRNAPLAVMSLDRLVSIQDYADFARTFAGIGKASAARLSDGRRELVHVTVAGAADIPIDTTSDLYANLVRALQANGDPYEPLQVAVRRLRLLVISARVKILADHLWEPVAGDVRSTLLDLFGFDRRDLGQPVAQSEVIAAIQAVAGVAYVDLEILDSVPEDATATQLASLADTLKPKAFIPADLARPNPAPADYPADAILAAEMVYLSPALPDTLILNEVKP